MKNGIKYIPEEDGKIKLIIDKDLFIALLINQSMRSIQDTGKHLHEVTLVDLIDSVGKDVNVLELADIVKAYKTDVE